MASNRFTFTRGKLRDLPLPREGWRYFYDDSLRGLAIGVGATGTKTFRVCRKVKGRPVRITLGLFDAGIPDTRELPDGAKPIDLLGNRPSLNVRMARRLATAVTAQLDTGVNPAAEFSESRKGTTLGSLFSSYAEYLRTKGKKSVPALTWMWERYLGQVPSEPRKPHGAKRAKAPGAVNWEHRLASEIRQEEVSRLWLRLGDKIGRTTANRVLGLLHATYRFGKKKKLYKGENPAEGNDKFQLVSRDRFLEKDEVQKFFEALDAGPQDFADFIRLSLFTGARRGNVLAMRWPDLNLDGARWRIAGEMMKGGEPVTVQLVEEAVEILRRRAAKREGEWVFPGDGALGHMGPPRKEWAHLLKRAGLADFRLHDLRRSLGSWMSNTGAATVMTMKALNHKSIKAALIYQQLESAPVRAAMQRAVSAISKAAKGEKATVIEMPRKARAGKTKAGR
jgi:integrase